VVYFNWLLHRLQCLIYNIHTNQINYLNSHEKLLCYSDDTVLFVEGQLWDDVFASVHSDMSKIQKWLCENNLFLNLEKFYTLPHYKVNSNQPNKTNLYYINENLSFDQKLSTSRKCMNRVKNCKYLGIKMCHNLKWNVHIKSVKIN